MGTHLVISIRLYSKVFASVSAAGLCSCSWRVHLLSQVAWLPAIRMVREACRLSSFTTTVAGELFFGNCIEAHLDAIQLQR